MAYVWSIQWYFDMLLNPLHWCILIDWSTHYHYYYVVLWSVSAPAAHKELSNVCGQSPGNWKCPKLCPFEKNPNRTRSAQLSTLLLWEYLQHDWLAARLAQFPLQYYASPPPPLPHSSPTLLRCLPYGFTLGATGVSLELLASQLSHFVVWPRPTNSKPSVFWSKYLALARTVNSRALL